MWMEELGIRVKLTCCNMVGAKLVMVGWPSHEGSRDFIRAPVTKEVNHVRLNVAPLEQRDTWQCHVQPLHMAVLCPEHGGDYTEFMAVRCTRVMEHQWPLGRLYAYKGWSDRA